MKKYLCLALIFITFAIIGCTKYLPKEDGISKDSPSGEESFCNTNDDCIPIVFECGSCVDNTTAINKKYRDKYLTRYQKKCSDNMMICAKVPGGTSECVNNKCTLKK